MSFKGLTIGVSGLKSQNRKMEVIGNNLANINTAGFKKGVVAFNELFSDTIKGASSGDGGLLGGTNPIQTGGGSSVAAVSNVFSQGARVNSLRALDFMIEGDDFFVARNSGDGSIMLSRNGSFQLDGNLSLTDAFGNKIQGFNVDKDTGVISATASDIALDATSIDPNATSLIQLEANIDSSAVEKVADISSSGWELFSGGENFGAMEVTTLGTQGARSQYGTGYYEDNYLYIDAAATLNGALDTVTLAVAPASAIEGYRVGDVVSLLQGANQVQRTITAVNTGTRAITLSSPAPGTFASGPPLTITNLTHGSQTRGSSAGLVHNDVLRSQISLVDDNGALLASFYRVGSTPQKYTHATATLVGGATITVGTGEFTSIHELADLIETTLRDSLLSNYTASTDLDVSVDKYGKVSLGGAGLVQSFRLVINADNTEMLDRFSGIAITDNAAVATTQARADVNNQLLAAPALGLGLRATNNSKNWFSTAGLENYGHSSTSPATEYGEFAGLRLDGGADGNGFGTLQLSLTNALGVIRTKEFRLVHRHPDPSANEFSTMGELAKAVQNTLRNSEFSSLAVDGVLVSDQSATATFAGGRLNVATSNGSFNNLTLTPVNQSGDSSLNVTRSDNTNFGTVLGDFTSGVFGKSGVSNKFISADVQQQTQVYDSQGNLHRAVSYFVRDRSSGLINIEWKYKVGLNPNVNSFAEDDPNDSDIYAATFNTVQDSTYNTGVLAFGIDTGNVLGSDAADSDNRYSDVGNLSFTATKASQEADLSNITIDFTRMSSFNGKNSVTGVNTDGYALGNLIRITSESNTGTINGVYSNGQIRSLARIGLMAVTNPEGLEKVGNSYFIQTPNSDRAGNTKGIDQVFAVGNTAGLSSDHVESKIHGNALEGSNVDLTEELTEMIITQRSYSASGKIITTSDDMLQEALNLKR